MAEIINKPDRYGQYKGTTGDDNIYSSYNNTTVNAAAGNDSLENAGSHVIIYAGTGNDHIYNSGGAYVTIDGGDGSDTVVSYSSYSLIKGGAGNDSINSTAGFYVTMDGGDGNDTIRSSAARSSINGGAGDDLILVSGNNTTIFGGTGNDTMTGSSEYINYFQYSIGGGNDIITNYKDLDEISILDGEIANVSLNGSDFIIKLKKWGKTDVGSLTIQNSITKRIRVRRANGNYVYYDPADYIKGIVNNVTDIYDSPNHQGGGYNFGNDTTIKTGVGDDRITNTGNRVLILTDDGSDTVTATGRTTRDTVSNVTIDAGPGDDYITSNASDSSIEGGDGNDLIHNGSAASHEYNKTTKSIDYLNSYNVTINGGKGNDTIHNYGANVLIDCGADDDYVNAVKTLYRALVLDEEGE